MHRPIRTLQRTAALFALSAALVACGGGGGSSTSTAGMASLKNVSIPAGFDLGSASMKSRTIDAQALLAAASMPAGYADENVYTWVNLNYTDPTGQSRTLALIRWSALARAGAAGIRVEVPTDVDAILFDVYNANGNTSGKIPS